MTSTVLSSHQLKTSRILIRLLFAFTVVTFTCYGISDSFVDLEVLEVQDSMPDDGDKNENEENEKKELDDFLTIRQKIHDSARAFVGVWLVDRDHHPSPARKIQTPPPELA